jgi:hypothetical protein
MVKQFAIRCINIQNRRFSVEDGYEKLTHTAKAELEQDLRNNNVFSSLRPEGSNRKALILVASA